MLNVLIITSSSVIYYQAFEKYFIGVRRSRNISGVFLSQFLATDLIQ